MDKFFIVLVILLWVCISIPSKAQDKSVQGFSTSSVSIQKVSPHNSNGMNN